MRRVPEATLLAIQEHFHGVIRERAAELTEQQTLDEGVFHCAVPLRADCL
ncbi:MAG TPA: hypothetical protein PKC18_07765 [Lacipirellulaceae bacterium]|nr:hypothetical protein [Lacipirellulaceae bacterium]HMP05764.1 hypothetical protein [Lacipirellulaceae bacterium]